MLLALAVAAITISADFEGGSIGKVERVAPAHFRCAVAGQSDQEGRNRQANWYYFRIDGAASQPVTIDLVNLVGEYNYKPGSHAVTRGTRPVFSYDRRHWQALSDAQVEWDEKDVRLTLRFTPQRSPVWIAHIAPYVNADLDSLLAAYASHRSLTREVAGRTVRGREIPLLTVTDPGVPDHEKKVVWLMFRQHAWESHTSWVAEGALRFLLSDDAAAVGIRRGFIFKILPMADPDGVARGGVRFNANGYDLNRNWDATDYARLPEIAAERKAVLDWIDSGHRIDLFMTFHNTESAEYISAPLSAGGPALQTLAAAVSRELKHKTTFCATHEPEGSGLSTTPGKPGRASVEQGLFRDRKIPAFLMEQMVERNPCLGRVPTVEDRLRFGADFIKAIRATLQPE